MKARLLSILCILQMSLGILARAITQSTDSWNYTVYEIVDGQVVRTTKSSGEPNHEVSVPYRRYNVRDGRLYLKDASGGSKGLEYNYYFTLTKDNQVENINYEPTDIENVVFLAEGEDIPGMTPCDNGNMRIRSSNSLAAYAADGPVAITTLPAGLYQLTAYLHDVRKATPDSYWSFFAGDREIANLHCTYGNIQELQSELFTLNEETTLYIPKCGNEKSGIDLLYITKIPLTTIVSFPRGEATISRPFVLEQSNVPWPGMFPDGKLCMLPEPDGSAWVCYWAQASTYRTEAATTHLEDHFSNNNWRTVMGRNVNQIEGFNDGGSWITGIRRLDNTKLVGFFHAESWWPNGDGTAFKSTGVTYSHDNGKTWEPGQRIIAPSYAKPETPTWGGTGDCCVVWNPQRQQYICYYSPWFMCMAASSDPNGAAGTWKKWDGKDFTIEACNQETQIGGNDVKIEGLGSIPLSNPSVMYNEYLGCWVMVCHYWDRRSIYISFSDDGIKWEEPALLVKKSIDNCLYPNLISDQGDVVGGKTMRLYYARKMNNNGARELAYREIEFDTYYNYTVNEVVDNKVVHSTKGRSTSGEVFVPYHRYHLHDGKLYLKNASGGPKGLEYNHYFTLTENNQVETINYEPTDVEKVVFLAEGEDIPGMTLCDNDNMRIRSSNSAAAYAADGPIGFVTLPAGFYQLTAFIHSSNKNPDSYWSFLAGDKEIANLHCTVVNIQELQSEVFTLNKKTTLYIPQYGDKRNGIDLLYITKEKDMEPVTITAENKTMTYGDDVPSLTYKSSGGMLNGTPKLSTTATKTSSVGTYPIKVEQGTVTNENIIYVDGTLTIEKAPLTIGAQDVTITEGDDIPVFTLTYSGWRNNDTEANAFTKKPTATTTATKTSDPGTYSITVSGGEAKNYALTYMQGTLTIEAKPKVLPDVSGMTKVHDFDFTQSDYHITLDENDQRGTAWETGNARQQKIYNVATPVEMHNVLALQSTYSGESGTKGWWVRGSKGGLWCYAATRSGAVLNLSKGDIVVFESSAGVDEAVTLTNGSGDPDGPFTFVKTSDGMTYYCTMTADGQLGFCGTKNKGYITSIKVYSNNTTGIKNIKAAESPDGETYDLYGRKLTSPKKGINIIDGKKVIQ
jgi:hypothetical protein